MSEMVVNCPHCQGAVALDTQYAGQTVACPHCQGGIIVPAPAPLAAETGGEEPLVSNQSPVLSEPTPESNAEPSQSPASPEPTVHEAPAEPEVVEPEVVVPESQEVAASQSPATQRISKPKGRPVEAAPGDSLITFPCPGCGEELEIPESAIGDPVGCPDCGREVTNDVPKTASGKKKVIVRKKTVGPMRSA